MDLDRESSATKDLLEKLPEIFAYAELDNNLRDKREIYLAVAEFIKSKLDQPLPICLNVAHILLQEKNSSLLEDGGIGGDRIIENVKELIVTIVINYESKNYFIYNRKIEIYFLQNGLRKVQRVQDLMDWDELPSNIRANRLRKQGINIITLYPKEK